MAQVNQNAWNQGSLMYRDSLDRDRQARQDEMQAERFGWEREEVGRKKQAIEDTREIATRQRAAIAEEPSAPVMFGNAATAEPGAPAPAAAANPAINNATTGGADNPSINNIAAGMQQSMAFLSQKRQQALSAYDMAMANNDRQGMQQAAQAIQALNGASQRANIFNSILSNPQAIKQVADNMTANPGIALKAQVDPKTGITTLVRDDGYKAQMSPAQMAMTAVHMWDLQNGDPSALDKIAGINKDLAASLAQANGVTATTTKSANDALTQGASLDQTRAHTDYYRAAAARQQAVADNGGSTRSGGGAGKEEKLWELAGREDVLQTYGGDRNRAYSALKRGQDRGGIEQQANAMRAKLLEKENLSMEEVDKRVGSFLHSNGVPPPAAIQALRSGKRPDGKPLTADDITAWDKTYPTMTSEDVLGRSVVPTPEQMELIKRDAAAQGIKNPTFSWENGGMKLKGAVNPGQAGAPEALPARMGAQEAQRPTAANYNAEQALQAEARIKQAQANLQRYGLAQRQRDPQGFEQAQAEYQAAVEEGRAVIPRGADMARIRAAQAVQARGQTQAGFRYPAP